MMGEARDHYTDMVLAKREAAFRQAQTEQEYIHRLLDEYRSAEEQLAPLAWGIESGMYLGEQEALLESYLSVCNIRRDRWRYHLH